MANHEFVAYIDESGDDGLSDFREVGKSGSSHWLVLGACIVRRINDRSLVGHRDTILKVIGRTQTRELDFASLKHEKKTVACQMLTGMPVAVSNIICCKMHIPKPDTYKEPHQLYWYLCRTLIERISWFCVRYQQTNKPMARIVFSNRGGMKYEDFRDYLKRLKEMKDKTSIKWQAISPDEVESYPSSMYAGLQFADISAGAFGAGVEPNHFGNTEPTYARVLRPIVYRRRGRFGSYGAKFRCTDAQLTPAQREFKDSWK